MSSLNPLTKFEEVHDSDLVVTITKNLQYNNTKNGLQSHLVHTAN